MRMFHIVDRAVWARAEAAGEYRPASLAAEGYVHFSYAHQVRATWRNYYAEVPDLVVVEIDAAQVADALKVESGFPHVYAPIPTSAAVSIRELDDPLFTTPGSEPTDR